MSSLHLQIKQNPVNFNIQCAGVAPLPICTKWRYLILKYTTKKGLYSITDQEVTIPGLLISYYNSEKIDLCGSLFYSLKTSECSVKQYFEYNLLNLKILIQSSVKNCFVNGLPNVLLPKKWFPIDKWNQVEEQLKKRKEGDSAT
jgi:hypothetical protein